MSASPGYLLAKLDELKKWQEEQHERLLKQHKTRLDETDRDLKSTITEYDSVPKLSVNDPPEPKQYEEIIIDDVGDLGAKPKKPFLKRGTGLEKFGMKPGDQKRPFNKMKANKSAIHKRLEAQRKREAMNRKKLEEQPKVKILSDILIPPQEITPLKIPDVEIEINTDRVFAKKTSPVQQPSIENTSNDNEPGIIHIDALNALKQLAVRKFGKPVETDNSADWILQQIEEEIVEEKLKSPKKISPPQTPKMNQSFNSTVFNSPELNIQLFEYIKQLAMRHNINLDSLSTASSQCGDITGYEKSLERELRVFEHLEQKVLNSSFCSTNSSIINLLSSTPHSVPKNDVKAVPIAEKKEVHFQEVPRNSLGAKRELTFVNVSDESSVTSEDLEQDVKYFASAETSSSTLPTTKERVVIVKQNACVMTDPIDMSMEQSSDETLKNRIQDLNDEIITFRNETAKLKKLKSDVENEQRELQKSRKKMERELQDERIKMEYELEEERKKLSKEKMVFERYVKDLQNKPSRKEREEISNLKSELTNVKETLKLKETRNGTTQARLRNQVKSLEKETGILKEEIEKLQKLNAKLTASQKVARKPSETKMLQEINKNLTKLTQDAKVGKQAKQPEQLNDSFVVLEGASSKKRSSGNYESEYRRSFSAGTKTKNLDSDEYSEEELSKHSMDPVPQTRLRTEFTKRSKSVNDGTRRPRSDEFFEDINEGQNNYRVEKENDKNTTNFDTTAFRNLSNLSLEDNYEKMFGKRNSSLNDTQRTNSKIENILEDGTKEIKYPNGNIKLISADGNIIQLKYYNGDIKETKLLEGTIKYFYTESDMWQTTLANGDEILEFSDGQIEKRFVDGKSEVKFPNGVLKLTDEVGVEKLMYPDGSEVTINGDEKVLLLPNGQKEIHTKEHKRREYPDGTVKILYPDGLQETRYSNGRIRMKDKDGNLLMDTHSDDL